MHNRPRGKALAFIRVPGQYMLYNVKGIVISAVISEEQDTIH